MADAYVGEIRVVPFNFEPRGWAFCDGRILNISQNTALFSLLGTMYGGDGRSTFGLPDLRSRVAVGQGDGFGLTPYAIAEEGGVETVTLTENQIPAHTHSVGASDAVGTTTDPTAGVYASGNVNPRFGKIYGSSANGTAAPEAFGVVGQNQPHDNRGPSQVLNYIIALEGVFPPRG